MTFAEFVKNVLLFWGFKLKVTPLRADSSAAKSTSERRGDGQTRHVQARLLWLQDKVAEQELLVDKVNGKKKDADLVTKVQPKSAIRQHLDRLGFSLSGRSGHKRIVYIKVPGQTPLLSNAAQSNSV